MLELIAKTRENANEIPGLYAFGFAQAGFLVTGVDHSQHAIEYASKYAEDKHLDLTYRYQNYLELEDENRYDAALLI
jgi:2-polyprenyl-3-methyl-5-hydroxy-6-metoxy-1,4-benzoquinol methylase